ncbi:MAG TPA: glycoside hydrolase family 15 protein [Actinomycetota bacterium]|nr:glycoside hydrolase family 15 protein [Actinomycetota bacterium]
MSLNEYPPIASYALLGDCHSSALVSREGSIDWCCFRRFDSRPVFAAILDRVKGGHFRIAPTDPFTVTRRYIEGTNVLETRFETDGGVIVLTDFLTVESPHRSGPEHTHPYEQLIRLIRCESGSVEIEKHFSPRFEYGLTRPRVLVREPDRAIVFGGADALVLQTDIGLDQTDISDERIRTTLRAGDERYVVLTHVDPPDLDGIRVEHDVIGRRYRETLEYWRAWSGRCRYDGPWRDQILRSALVLKALTYDPTGAIVAAPTTSLPEQIGGVRNWDYRYTWLRDAALHLRALFRLGYIDEAHAFMQWLQRTAAGTAENLQVLYGVGGERMVPEIELGHLEGYRGSAPVRIGNGAVDQFQLDMYGELMDTVWLYHRNGGEIDEPFWQFLCSVVSVVADCWREPDRGIWELRGEPRELVASKLFAWLAVDRGIRLAKDSGFAADLERWEALREEIRDWIETNGVDPATNAFRQSPETDEPDASLLLIPLTGFLPGDDPRVLATIRRVEERLMEDCLVRRYLTDDGLPGGEGAFVICTFWMVGALAKAGEVERATELFENMLGHANDLGLLSEEVDPETGDLLGNFPQAFSHLGLIQAAMNLREASRRSG